jgi:hypothetical protein
MMRTEAPQSRHRYQFDRRTKGAKRVAEITATLIAELGGSPSPAQRLLVDHAATMLLEVERLRAAVVRGEPADLAGMVRLTETAADVMSQLGLGGRSAA